MFAECERQTIHAAIDPAVDRGGGWLTTDECTRLLTAAGIPTVTTVTVASADDAVQAAERIGYPVVAEGIRTGEFHNPSGQRSA